MEDSRNDSLNELVANFPEEKFARLKEHVGRRDRAAAPAAAAPVENTQAPSTSIGMFMPSTVPELRVHENLTMFLQRFSTWASVRRCDSALDSENFVKTSGTPRAELERVHDCTLVANSLHVRQSLTKALEKESNTITAAFQGDGFSPFPPGSNCLLS